MQMPMVMGTCLKACVWDDVFYDAERMFEILTFTAHASFALVAHFQ